MPDFCVSKHTDNCLDHRRELVQLLGEIEPLGVVVKKTKSEGEKTETGLLVSVFIRPAPEQVSPLELKQPI